MKRNMQETNSPRLTFHGGVGEVTGANFLLEYRHLRVLIDCGLFQGAENERQNRAPFGYDPASIDCLLVTHAHLDHIGRIPKLVREGFRGVIYSTAETKKISEIMLADALHLLVTGAEKVGVYPLYGESDVAKTFALWKTVSYGAKISFSKDLEVAVRDAGHVLGSSMFEFVVGRRGETMRVLFTGDLGNTNSTLQNKIAPPGGIHYLVIESVYGDRNHESREEREEKFLTVVREAIERGGTLLIPAFSLERTQTILHKLNHLVEEKQIPSIPVFLDSPLAIKITRIYESISSLYSAEIRQEMAAGDDVFRFPKLKETARVAESQNIISVPNPKIIIAGSGMSTGGRVVEHEKHLLPDPKTTVLLLGYQAPGTLGRRIQDGVREVKIDDAIVRVRARVEIIEGYSAHMDSEHLIEFAESSKGTLRKVFVVMGEPKSSFFLAQRVRDYSGISATVPERGRSYPLF
ncbi:MBL fold metallo-hydrolase [Patescibacteria group bacterium]|nr:MAG: MBL fold metallo-hydrolase [Patescibacteria group bacterium]